MDVVVTVPQRLWAAWLAEGDLPGEPVSGRRYAFRIGRNPPVIRPGERVYVVAHAKLRGYAPLVELITGGFPDPLDERNESYQLIRAGGAVAVTLPCGTVSAITLRRQALCESVLWCARCPQLPPAGRCGEPVRITGFRGWRYRWWRREDEVPFPDWQEAEGCRNG